jgi:hypothetical protein
MKFFSRKKKKTWWVLGPGEKRELWAYIGKEGRVYFYNPNGKRVVVSKYSNFFRAQKTLAKQGYRKVARKDLEQLKPPAID